MKIEEVRTSFTIYVIASDLDRLGGVTDSLSLAGYMVASFSDLSSAFSEFASNPPHFLLFDGIETAFKLEKTIAQVTAQLPESHIFVIAPVEQRAKVIPLLEQGVYDLILLPLVSPVELVRAMDRAAERDYFMYLNERLMQESSVPTESMVQVEVDPDQPTDPSIHVGTDDLHLRYSRAIFAQTSVDDCIKEFISSASELLGGCPVVYFKYIANRRVLLAGQGVQLGDVELRGLGMNLNEAVEGFRSVQLNEPMRIRPFVEMVQEIFSLREFFACPIGALGEILGVICFLTHPPSAAPLNLVQDWLALLGKALSLLEAEKRLHVMSTKDLNTDLLNRQNFLAKINEEISRARRTRKPVCLVQICVDQYGQLTSLFGQEEANLVLRMAARILEKYSRVNDILGRTGADEFGLLLPHTNKPGAMIKAERLRRLLESADFSKVLSKFPHITVSLGVSEYPSLVRDAEELLQSADEALFQVRAAGNRTCVAKAPDNFQPDFPVDDSVPRPEKGR